MVIKTIKYLTVFCLLVMVVSCVNKQKNEAKQLGLKVDIFKDHNNTNVEFLSYLNSSDNYSYVVDAPLVVAKIIFPDTALFNINGISIAIEFNEREIYQSFPMLKEGASVLFQEGILLAKDSYYDIETKQAFKRFRLCRTDECRDLARISLSYMYKYSSMDPSIATNYKIDDLHKFLVDKDALK